MLFLVDDALFATPTESLFLTTLAGVCLLRSHRWLPIGNHDSFNPGPHYGRWLTKRTEIEQDAITTLIETSLLLEGQEPARRRVMVVPGESNWRRSSPPISLKDAILLAGKPFGLVLEGVTNDWAFLLVCADESQRRYLQDMLNAGLVEVINGGGLQSMKSLLEGWKLSTLFLRWVLFDSDSLVPERPSKISEEVRILCHEQNVPHHQLKRRAIENYLPNQTLQHWAGNASVHTERERRAATRKAWAQLTEQQQAHYNMKKGFDGDHQQVQTLKSPSKEEYQTLWKQMVSSPELAHGFGGDVASLFSLGRQANIHEQTLRDNGTLSEMMPVIQQLLEWLR
jgi:hypothetical protein